MKDTLQVVKDTIIDLKNSVGTETLNFIFQNKPEDNSSLITNIITIVLALIAATIALYQVKLNIISSARITWIESLRHTISEYFAETDNITAILINMKEEGLSGSVDASIKNWYPLYSESCKKYHNHAVKLRLYLNIKEKKHLEIETNVNAITFILEKKTIGEINPKDIEKHLVTIIEESRQIFKEEWDKSKNVLKK